MINYLLKNSADNETLIGDKYERKCESEEDANIALVRAFNEHGLTITKEAELYCSEDGTYTGRQPYYEYNSYYNSDKL